MTPGRVLVFLLVVFALLMLIGQLIPKDGLAVGNAFTLRMPRAGDVLFPSEREEVDIADILNMRTDADSTIDLATYVPDTLDADSMEQAPFLFDASRLAPLEERIQLHYPAAGPSVLHPLFAALESANNSARPIRLLHYGDSQLEGDRITSYVRNKLQTQFGGSGPGLVDVAGLVPHFSVDRVISDNWIRYSVMAKKDPNMPHARYGALSAFSRFTPILPDSIAPDTVAHTGTITLRPEKRCFGKAQVWSACKLYYGWQRTPLTMTMAVDGILVSDEVVQPANRLLVREWRFEAPPKEVTITLTGADSPDVFGVSLEGRRGVAMDNIAARGAAGYEFRKEDQDLLKAMYDKLDVKLLILQYGGNVLPYMKSTEEAQQYGRAIGAQIARFQRMIPGVCIIVIGPSDMSIKEGDAFVTRPYLEDVRDALRTNALAQGAVFWDMYEAMGGRNSMVSWVEAEPALAADDYIHFSPQGARKVGELFYSALISDFAKYHQARQ